MLIELPNLPPSTNQSLIASGNRLIHSKIARDYRKSAALAISNQITQHLRVNPALDKELLSMEGEPLFCEIRLFSSWLTQKNTIRKVDLANREKLIVDSLISALVEQGYKIGDEQIYMLLMSKHDNNNFDDKTTISIKLLSSFNKPQEEEQD